MEYSEASGAGEEKDAFILTVIKLRNATVF